MLSPPPLWQDITLTSKHSVNLLHKSKDNKIPFSFMLDKNLAKQLQKMYGSLPLLVEQLLAELLIQNIKDLDG